MLGDDCMHCLKQVLTLAAHFEEKFADEELQFNTNQVEHLLDDFQLNQKANDLVDADQMMKAFLSSTYEEDNPFDEDRQQDWLDPGSGGDGGPSKRLK